MRSQMLFAAFAVGVTLVSAAADRTRLFGVPKFQKDIIPPGIMHNATFRQIIDHSNPELGTFSQFYYYSDQFWGGPGSPVVLFTPGESAEGTGFLGYLTNSSLPGAFAQAIHGAVVLLEHRYWGQSSPFDKLTTENLQYLTLENSIADLTNFARNAQLPFDKNASSNAPQAPWVLTGGSYSGALAAWTASTAPGTFWAYHASSAPVEALSDFWSYNLPIQQGMPQNCSKDVSRVLDYVDDILEHGTHANKTALKSLFGFQKLQYDDDFAAALANPLNFWQKQQYFPPIEFGNYSAFYDFCDSIESGGTYNFSQPLPDANGVGLTTALQGYAAFYSYFYGYPQNGTGDISLLEGHNPKNPQFTDISVDNKYDRQWQWLLCTSPFDWWYQSPAPLLTSNSSSSPTYNTSALITGTSSSLVSRTLNPSYQQSQCELYFPPTPYGTDTQPSSPDLSHTDEEITPSPSIARPFHPRSASNTSFDGSSPTTLNKYTGGWDLSTLKSIPRLMWANGEFDPWRSVGVSSQVRPGGPLGSTETNPINIIPGGVHCWDMIWSPAFEVPEGLKKVVDTEVSIMAAWVRDFYPGGTLPGGGSGGT